MSIVSKETVCDAEFNEDDGGGMKIVELNRDITSTAVCIQSHEAWKYR